MNKFFSAKTQTKIKMLLPLFIIIVLGSLTATAQEFNQKMDFSVNVVPNWDDLGSYKVYLDIKNNQKTLQKTEFNICRTKIKLSQNGKTFWQGTPGCISSKIKIQLKPENQVRVEIYDGKFHGLKTGFYRLDLSLDNYVKVSDRQVLIRERKGHRGSIIPQ